MSTGMQTAVGQIVWHTLMTTDVERAKSFYGELLGWETTCSSRASWMCR
jgi:predicted enzyme related to lactoylglutathione lyase